MTHQEITRSIIQQLQVISKNYKQRYPILQYQDWIGMAILLISLIMSSLGAYAYLYWQVPAIPVILWIALWTSFLHELEHDLIHYLYFKKNPILHNFMMLGVWIFRPMTVSPWFRRHLHLHHHKYSGFDSDLEERAISNGQHWNFLRLIMIPDQIFAAILRMPKLYFEIRKMEREGKFTKVEIQNLYNIVFFGFLPIGIPLHLTWYAFLVLHFAIFVNGVFGLNIIFPETVFQFLALAQPFIVLLVIPNLLRQFCLHFISSNVHYYGDLSKGNFIEQTQILNKWWLFPFQLFCFNFGETHAIHHFLVQETFYIRQLTSAASLKILAENGVRVNDFGTFERDNRYNLGDS